MSISDFASRLVRDHLFRGGKIDLIISSIETILNGFFEGAKSKTDDELIIYIRKTARDITIKLFTKPIIGADTFFDHKYNYIYKRVHIDIVVFYYKTI